MIVPTQDAQQHLQRLLPLFHHSSVAMVEINAQGVIEQLNPKAVQLIMPLAMHLGVSGDKLLDVLSGFLPIGHEPYTLKFAVLQVWFDRHFGFTIEKTSPETPLVFFDDVTDFLIKADTMRQSL